MKYSIFTAEKNLHKLIGHVFVMSAFDIPTTIAPRAVPNAEKVAAGIPISLPATSAGVPAAPVDITETIFGIIDRLIGQIIVRFECIHIRSSRNSGCIRRSTCT